MSCGRVAGADVGDRIKRAKHKIGDGVITVVVCLIAAACCCCTCAALLTTRKREAAKDDEVKEREDKLEEGFRSLEHHRQLSSAKALLEDEVETKSCKQALVPAGATQALQLAGAVRARWKLLLETRRRALSQV